MKKIIKFMFLLILLIVNTSCIQMKPKKFSVLFSEGLFKYEGEPVLLIEKIEDEEEEDIYIEGITFDIREVEGEYNKSSINIMQNIANKKYYRGIFMIKFNVEEPVICNFTFEAILTIPDTYYIYPEVENIENKKIKFSFKFGTRSEEYNKNDKYCLYLYNVKESNGDVIFYTDGYPFKLIYQNDNEHQYIIDYKSFSNTHHKSFCECGLYEIEPHVYMNEGVTTKTSSCVKCGYNKEQEKEEINRNIITNII